MPTFANYKDVKSLEFLSLKSNTSVAIDLLNGCTCLYNPIVKSEKACAAYSALTHIVSPNHYHNKCLVSFQNEFPKASVCSSSLAKKRLEEITELKIKPLTAVKKQLPEGMEFYEPAGLKTGEVWLKFAHGKVVGWIVGDAFCGSKTSTKEVKVPQLLKPFPSYGVGDKQKYTDWVLEKIEEDKPILIIPCHGSFIRAADLPSKLAKLVNKL